MIEKYVTINHLLRTIITKCVDAYSLEVKDNLHNHDMIASYLLADLRELKRLWPDDLERDELDEAYEEIDKVAWEGEGSTFLITLIALDGVMEKLEQYFSNQNNQDISNTILDLLHSTIISSSYHHFRNGHYRDAVLNAIVAVFDQIRERTDIDMDGHPLVQNVFSPNSPKLVVSTLHTESGRNDQIGFMKLLEGAYSSIRNPKAHSLSINPNKMVAAQNLVFISLLARRVEEAIFPEEDLQE